MATRKSNPKLRTTSPSNSYTLERFISLGRGVAVSYDGFSYKEKLSNGTEIAVHNVINDYLEELKEVATNVKFSKDEYRRYKFKPKLLCYDVYGNTEVYFVIMLINGIIDVKDFDKQTVKLLRVDDMNNLLSAIYNAEFKYIKDYNSERGL